MRSTRRITGKARSSGTTRMTPKVLGTATYRTRALHIWISSTRRYVYTALSVDSQLLTCLQAQKFGSFADDDDEDDELDEESLLETPLDKIEPFGLFKNVFLGTLHWSIDKSGCTDIGAGLQQEQPQLYENLTKILNPDEQQIIQSVFHEADNKALEAANTEAAIAASLANDGN